MYSLHVLKQLVCDHVCIPGRKNMVRTSLKSTCFTNFMTGLKIYFNEVDYSTDESDITGLSGISLSLREAQAPFRMELIPTTIDVAETVYGLTVPLCLGEITEDQKAKSGEICVCISRLSIHTSWIYSDVLKHCFCFVAGSDKLD